MSWLSCGGTSYWRWRRRGWGRPTAPSRLPPPHAGIQPVQRNQRDQRLIGEALPHDTVHHGAGGRVPRTIGPVTVRRPPRCAPSDPAGRKHATRRRPSDSTRRALRAPRRSTRSSPRRTRPAPPPRTRRCRDVLSQASSRCWPGSSNASLNSGYLFAPSMSACSGGTRDGEAVGHVELASRSRQ